MAKQAKSTGKTESKTKSSPAGSAPLIDTNLAASSAAKLLVSRSRGLQAGNTPSGGNSAMFKQMKENLAKPHLEGMNSLLNQSAPPDHLRSELPSGMKQSASAQVNTANTNRTGVPRRTAG